MANEHLPSTELLISVKALMHHSVNSSWEGPLLNTFITCCSSLLALLFGCFGCCLFCVVLTVLEETLLDNVDGLF